jgi:hypothetical protein
VSRRPKLQPEAPYRRLSPQERAALVQRAEECPCWCGDVYLDRDLGWTWTDHSEESFGETHTLIACDEPGGAS